LDDRQDQVLTSAVHHASRLLTQQNALSLSQDRPAAAIMPSASPVKFPEDCLEHWEIPNSIANAYEVQKGIIDDCYSGVCQLILMRKVFSFQALPTCFLGKLHV